MSDTPKLTNAAEGDSCPPTCSACGQEWHEGVERDCIKRGKCGVKPPSLEDQLKRLADDWFSCAVDEMNGAAKEKNARDGMNFYQHTARAAVLSDCRKQLMGIILPNAKSPSVGVTE